MVLTSEKALEILERERGNAPDDYWIDHSICVGNTAGIIARALSIDEDKAKALGFIHDIGKRYGWGNGQWHVIDGYEYLLELGVDEDYANICLTHSYLNNDINCVAGGVPCKKRRRYDFVKNFIANHEYTIHEKLINLCDLLCNKHVKIMEKRIVNIIDRYGVFENTVYHIKEAQKLKQYFDELLGYNVYKLFPDIQYN